MAHTYGYARVSSKDQHEDRQIIALKHFGVEQIFCDHLSGKNFNRPEYRKLLRRLKDDDVLVVKSIDRLGRNYSEILDQWRVIAKDKGAAIVVLDTSYVNVKPKESRRPSRKDSLENINTNQSNFNLFLLVCFVKHHGSK